MPGHRTQAERMAVLETQMTHATKALDTLVVQGQAASESRKRVYEAQEEFRREMQGMKSTVESLDRRVGAMEPSVEDYRTKVIQVNAAGRIGRVLWAVGGFLLASAAWLVGMWDAVIKHLRP